MRFSVRSSVVLPLLLLPACAMTGGAPSDEGTARDSVEIRRELAGMSAIVDMESADTGTALEVRVAGDDD